MQVADAIARITADLTPKVTVASIDQSVFAQNTNAPDATASTYQSIRAADQYALANRGSKSIGNYAQDAAVSLGKGIVAVPQAMAGLVDIADTGLSAAHALATGQDPSQLQTGRFSKGLQDLGVDFKAAQDFIGEFNSDLYKQQQAELSQIEGMSMDKSFSENMSSLGDTLSYVVDNPSLAANTVVESIPSILGGGLIGKGIVKGASALAGRASASEAALARIASLPAGAIGEGSIMAGGAQAQMRNESETGYTTAEQTLGALGIGIAGGAIGSLGGKLAARQGAVDVDNLAAGMARPATASSAIKSLVTGTGTEALEEGLQTTVETLGSNYVSNKDLLDGYNQDLVLGAFAGGLMGAATNAPSAAVTGAMNTLTSVAEKQSAKIKERILKEAPEKSDLETDDLINPNSETYNPAAGIMRVAQSFNSSQGQQDTEVLRTQMVDIVEGVETKLQALNAAQEVLAKLDVKQRNLDGLTNMIAQVGEQSPQGQQFSIMKAAIEQEIESVQPFIGKEAELQNTIKQVQTQVNEAQDTYKKFEPMLGTPQAAATPGAKIFAAPTSFSPEEYATAIADPSIPEETKQVLRVLSNAVVAQNRLKDLEAVNQQVMGKSTDPNYISTPQYLEKLSDAIKRGSPTAIQNLMTGISNFESSHVAKSELATQALEQAMQTGKSVQVISTGNGGWEINTGPMLNRTQAKENGTVTIHPPRRNSEGSTGLVEALQLEAEAIKATREAMTALANQGSQQQAPVAPETMPQSFTDVDPMEAALDSYNQDMRSANEWQPNQRSEDPRSTNVLAETANTPIAEAGIPTEVQPTSGSTTTANQSIGTEPSVQAIDDLAKASEVSERSDSVETDTEAEPSDSIQGEDSVTSSVSTEVEATEKKESQLQLNRKEERAKPIEKRNLVKDGFNRTEVPLVKVPDMIKYFTDKNIPRIINKITGLTATQAQVTAVNSMIELGTTLEPIINSLVSVRNKDNQADYNYKDYIQYLVDDQGKFDSNTITAMAAAAHTWLAENGSSIVKSPKEVASLLRLQNVESIPDALYSEVAELGDYRNMAIMSLGQKVSAALGYKLANDVAPERKAKLEAALGGVLIKAMDKAGYVELHNQPVSVINDIRAAILDDNMSAFESGSLSGMAETKGKTKVNNFVRIPSSEGKPVQKVQAIIDASKATNGILTKLFAVKSEILLPSLTVPKAVKKSFNDFGTVNPQEAVEIFEKSQKYQYGLSASMVEVFSKLRAADETAFKKLAGFKTEDEIAELQITHQKPQVSVNQDIERAISIYDDVVAMLEQEADINAPFYMGQYLVGNTRSHYNSDFTPQMNKIHRAVAGMVSHRVSIDPSQELWNEDGITDHGRYLQAISMNMEDAQIVIPGFKTGTTTDKITYQQFLPAFLNYIQTPLVQDAISAMQDVISKKDVTPENFTAIQAAVSEFGMGMLSLRALESLARRETAIQSGQSFDADIAFESDGVTNGPFITGVMTDTIKDEARSAGGMFKEGDIKSVPEYKQFGGENGTAGKDIYEFLGDTMLEVWTEMKADAAKSPVKLGAMNALDSLYDAFGQRKGAKPITTTANYGAGNNSIKRASSREVLAAFYKILSKNDPVKANQAIDSINSVIQYNNSVMAFTAKEKAKKNGTKYVPVKETPLAVAQGSPLEFQLTTAQIAAVMQGINRLHGKAIEESLKRSMGDFMPVRDGITKAATTAFALYKKLYDDALDVALKTAQERGEVELFKGKPIEGLSVKQTQQALKQIAKYTPAIKSALGSISKNSNESAIPLMKSEKVWKDEGTYDNELHLNGGGMGIGSLMNEISDPGVSGLALGIQSVDSFITHYTVKRVEAQNYHDANAGSITEATRMAQVQNEGFLKAMLNFHLNSNFAEALLKPLEGSIDLGSFTKDSIPALEAYFSLDKEDTLSNHDVAARLKSDTAKAFDRDISKLNKLAQYKYINQYGTQDGHYTLTESDLKDIEKAKKALYTAKYKAVEKASRLGEEVNKVTGYKEPVNNSTQAFLKEGTHTLKELMPVLRKDLAQYFKKDGTQSDKFTNFYESILGLVQELAPDTLEINYFQQGNEPENVHGVEEALEQGTAAWFTTGKDGKPQINMFETTDPVRAKVMVHELIHAITADAIANTRSNPNANPKAKESLAKLDALYEHVKSVVAADKNASDVVKYGVTNLDEFIATGFSYPEFVDYLDGIVTVPKAARGMNRISNALKAFASNVLGILHAYSKGNRGYSAKDVTALEALILDTTEFLSRAEQPVVGMQQGSLFGAPQAQSAVDGFTTREVFDALDSNLDPEFKSHLARLMTEVSDTVYAGLDQYLITNPNKALSAEQAWEEYIDQGKNQTTESAVTAGFRMTAQETFAVESLNAALTQVVKDKTMTAVYSELNKTFSTARTKLKPQDFHPGDWATADKYEKATAQDMYDFLFKLSPSNPEPLARFTAMAIASQQVNSLLGFTTKADAAPTDTFEKILGYVNDALSYVFGLLTNTRPSQAVKDKVSILARELARIDASSRSTAVGILERHVGNLEDNLDGISNKFRDKITEIAKKDIFAKSKYDAVRLASNTTRLSAQGELWTTLDTIKDLHDMDKPGEPNGFFNEIINETANSSSTKNAMEKILRKVKLHNQTKEQLREATKSNVLATFDENGTYLKIEDKAAISLMLRSDVQSLYGQYTTADIAKLYSTDSYLTREINTAEQALKKADPKAQLMINRAKQLAKYMVTGKSSNGLAKNATLIVSGFNSGEIVSDNDPRIALVDTIASLYAIQYTDSKSRKLLNAVMKRELKNKTNGIETSIKFHKELTKTAKDTLFVNNPTSAAKGYIPEVTNPHREVRVATSDAEAVLLKDQYFKEVRSLGKDAKDASDSTPRLFLNEEANRQRIVSGAVELVSTNRKGTAVFMDKKTLAQTVKAVEGSMPNSASYNPMKDPEIYMVPNYNTLGDVIGFSYEMSAANRDNLLERNNDFSDLLGAYAATNFNKTTVPAQNRDVIDALFEDYKDNFVKNPRSYVAVGPNASDVGLREMWAMLPQDTRDHIESVWGQGQDMLVRKDVLLMTFGYRKYSLNQAFDKQKEARSTFEDVYVYIMRELFGSNAKVKGARAERMWQEAVSLMKDIIVIRNVKTMMANMMSNTFLLMAHGVPASDIVKDTVMSIRAGISYRKDMALLTKARQNQRAGVGNFNELEQEILRLEDSIMRNPLRGFIEEGMLPTIVEDLDPESNHYSYRSKLDQKASEYTDNLPKSVVTAAKWLMVSPDTPAYKFLNNATQFSDFSSKYVMYKYYTTKAKEKLSNDEALQIASDNFINYDIPTGKGLQYLNDMGLVMFTKYNLRIQKALFQLLKKRPATAMAQAIFINSFTNLEAGIDPLIWFNMGNPLREGAFGLPGALDEPFPVQALGSIF